MMPPSRLNNGRSLLSAAATILPNKRAPRRAISFGSSSSLTCCAVRVDNAVQEKIPCVDEPDLADAEEFAERFVKARKPAILRGACRSWLPLVDRHWSEQRLLERCGDNRVTLSFTSGDARFGKTSMQAVEFAAERETTLRCAWKELFTPGADGIGASKASYLFSGKENALRLSSGLTLRLLHCTSQMREGDGGCTIIPHTDLTPSLRK